jgi:putative transposase
MPRTARVAPGGIVFHVLNRGVARMQLFEKPGDYEAFDRVLNETLQAAAMRLLAYCLMPNHWHLLLWPEHDGDLAAFMQRLTITHVRRWQENRRYVGLGHVYQGRYKSFPVEEDEHFFAAARYVERNALRANLVLRAEEWHWSSLWRRCRGGTNEREVLAQWPLDMPTDWLDRVNRADNDKELEALRRSVQRGRPYGTSEWQRQIAKRLGLDSAYRSDGRPRIARQQNQIIDPL